MADISVIFFENDESYCVQLVDVLEGRDVSFGESTISVLIGILEGDAFGVVNLLGGITIVLPFSFIRRPSSGRNLCTLPGTYNGVNVMPALLPFLEAFL